MISLGDCCLSCIIEHIDSYESFSSLPSEACEAILLLLKGKVTLSEDLLLKFGECYISCLDLSKEDQLDYPSFLSRFASSPSASTITSLSLAYSEIEDLSFLRHFPHLSTLNLRGCTGWQGESINTIVSCLPSLTTLVLSKCNQIGDADLEPLQKLTSLVSLKLDHCDKITSEGVLHISQVPNLRYLSLSHCPELRHPESCAALGNLSNLRYLDLSYCNVTDESFPPATLKSLSSLMHLEITMNKLSSQFIESISVSLLDLRALELGHSANLHKGDIICLNRLPLLKTMHMSNGRRDKLRISVDETILRSFPIIVSTATQLTESTQRQLATIPEATPAFPGDLNKPIVLLGEDEQFQARLVKTVLERKNFIVQIAPDGITAYNMYKEEYKKFALVMMDIFLPKMDGLQSIRLIRKFETENKSKHIPVIICSGNPQMKTKQSNYLEESGGDLFIPKPFPKSLVGLIISMTTPQKAT